MSEIVSAELIDLNEESASGSGSPDSVRLVEKYRTAMDLEIMRLRTTCVTDAHSMLATYFNDHVSQSLSQLMALHPVRAQVSSLAEALTRRCLMEQISAHIVFFKDYLGRKLAEVVQSSTHQFKKEYMLRAAGMQGTARGSSDPETSVGDGWNWCVEDTHSEVSSAEGHLAQALTQILQICSCVLGEAQVSREAASVYCAFLTRPLLEDCWIWEEIRTSSIADQVQQSIRLKNRILRLLAALRSITLGTVHDLNRLRVAAEVTSKPNPIQGYPPARLSPATTQARTPLSSAWSSKDTKLKLGLISKANSPSEIELKSSNLPIVLNNLNSIWLSALNVVAEWTADSGGPAILLVDEVADCIRVEVCKLFTVTCPCLMHLDTVHVPPDQTRLPSYSLIWALRLKLLTLESCCRILAATSKSSVVTYFRVCRGVPFNEPSHTRSFLSFTVRLLGELAERPDWARASAPNGVQLDWGFLKDATSSDD